MRDDSLDVYFLYNRLRQAYMEHDRLIIAYDLDDTVRPYKSKSCENVKALLKRAKDMINPYYIVYTANPNLQKNIAFLEKEELPYDSINKNPDFIGDYGEGIKLYYNLFFDDKAGIYEPYFALKDLLDDIEKGFIPKKYNARSNEND